MSRFQAHQWTAEHTYNYVMGMLAAENDDEDYNSTLITALSISYEYLTNATKRKVTWSLSLQKLAYEFIELAFETNMQSSIKDVFKSYRAITQGQYSESLKDVLEHFRDRKLQVILDEDIREEDIPLIRALPNIEVEDPSPELIVESLEPEVKQRRDQLRSKLRVVWEGYKSIVETVRVNQKLEDVYMTTLNKIFDFVERYNRVAEFKAFCRSLRSGLQNAFTKRTEQHKAIYIDIEKTDVNTRNIEIRLKQFEVTTKLGLWGEGFQVLEDINTLIRVRRAPLKNSLRCQYFECLATTFRQNCLWHYHACALYNHYLAFITKPKLTLADKQSMANQLLLAILAVPVKAPESNNSREIQEKISSMMISSSKMPTHQQLGQLMVSRGVLETAANDIKDFWNFMFLEFNVNSLKKGLSMVEGLKKAHSQHKLYHGLIEGTLINRQLSSIAEVYQRIRLSSLERLIPLPLDQIKAMLIQAHKQRTLSFTFDEAQGAIIFEDQDQQINPTQQFHELFIEVSLLNEREKGLDERHIRGKVDEFIKTAENYFWTIRQYKIDDFKRVIKHQEAVGAKEAREKLKAERDRLEHERLEREAKEAEERKKEEDALRILAAKRNLIKDIISIKENRVVRIMDKKVEHLTDEQVENLEVEVLQQHLEATKKKIANNREAKLRKVFTHVDYLERQRRELLKEKLQSLILSPEDEEKLAQARIQAVKKDKQEREENRGRLQNVAHFYKGRIEKEVQAVNDQFDSDLKDYKERLNEHFRDKVLARAKALLEENKKKKELQLKQQELEQAAIAEHEASTEWKFRAKAPALPTSGITIGGGRKETTEVAAPSRPAAPARSTNVFESLEGVNNDEPAQTGGKWSIGKKVAAEPQKKETPPVNSAPTVPPQAPPKDATQSKRSYVNVNDDEAPKAAFVPPPAEGPKTGKWGSDEKKVFAPPAAEGEKKGRWGAEKPAEEKKEEKWAPPPASNANANVKKGKGW